MHIIMLFSHYISIERDHNLRVVAHRDAVIFFNPYMHVTRIIEIIFYTSRFHGTRQRPGSATDIAYQFSVCLFPLVFTCIIELREFHIRTRKYLLNLIGFEYVTIRCAF